MVVLGGWLFLMSEVPLYSNLFLHLYACMHNLPLVTGDMKEFSYVESHFSGSVPAGCLPCKNLIVYVYSYICEGRNGTGPPRARAKVMHVDLGYWAISSGISSCSWSRGI